MPMAAQAKKTTLLIPPRVERMRIAAQAGCDERSVRRAYSGLSVRSTTYERIMQASRVLAVAPPPGNGAAS